MNYHKIISPCVSGVYLHMNKCQYIRMSHLIRPQTTTCKANKLSSRRYWLLRCLKSWRAFTILIVVSGS